MRTLYYVNGKRVSINTYFAAESSNLINDYLWKSCESYYKKNPDEFEKVAMFSKKEDLAFQLMSFWERTEDYKEKQEKIDKMKEKDQGCLLIVILVFGFLFFILPFILIFSGALN